MTTIFAPITSTSHAGIFVIRISGPKTKLCLKSLGFKGIPQHQKISFQKILDPKTSKTLDEALISFFKSPQSFTGEDVAEISIHASPFILKKILKILSQQKECFPADAGEFSKRAFLNGKLDLVQAEAIPDLIAAETEAQHNQALKQLEGNLSKVYEGWRTRLIEISAMIEAAIDFPDEDLPTNIIDRTEKDVKDLCAEIKNHLNDKKIGQKIKEGLNLAILGAPNTGKSSLINFLAQSDVAIVSEIAGTTRDIVETHLSIANMAVKISDTAGIRKTSDKIEQEGVKRALKKAKTADIKIVMIDATNPASLQDLICKNSIIVVNKIDLISNNSLKNNLNFNDPNFIKVSLTKNINTSKLLKELEKKVLEFIPNQNSPLITQERYRVTLENCIINLEEFSMNKNIELAAEDLRLAAREVGKIIGKVDVENILDIIFSRFCIGK